MNLTLAVDPGTVERARKAAESMGKSLNQAIREYLEELGGLGGDAERDIEELERLSAASGGRSGGRRVGRNELHERP